MFRSETGEYNPLLSKKKNYIFRIKYFYACENYIVQTKYYIWSMLMHKNLHRIDKIS